MKRIALFVAAASMFSVAAFAETWSGSLVDVSCKDKDLAGHTTKCALGCAKSGAVFKQPLRVVEVATGKTDSQGQPEILVLATDRLDLDAELVALAYRFRWSVELFFRWFKCILGCRHLLSTSPNGVTIQLYVGIIASLLISLWAGRKPTKRTLEMLQFYFAGWATLEEVQAHLDGLANHAA